MDNDKQAFDIWLFDIFELREMPTDEIRKLMYDVNEDESSWNKGESSPLDIATLGPWMKFRINMSPRPGLERQEAEKLQMLHRNKDLNRESEPQINKYRKAKGAGSDWA